MAKRMPKEGLLELDELLRNKSDVPKEDVRKILIKYGMTADPEQLMRRDLDAKVQRLISRYRDKNGDRDILADHNRQTNTATGKRSGSHPPGYDRLRFFFGEGCVIKIEKHTKIR